MVNVVNILKKKQKIQEWECEMVESWLFHAIWKSIISSSEWSLYEMSAISAIEIKIVDQIE